MKKLLISMLLLIAIAGNAQRISIDLSNITIMDNVIRQDTFVYVLDLTEVRENPTFVMPNNITISSFMLELKVQKIGITQFKEMQKDVAALNSENQRPEIVQKMKERDEYIRKMNEDMDKERNRLKSIRNFKDMPSPPRKQ